MIIDCHCHAGQGDGFSGPWDTRASLARYAQRAAQAGIARTVLLPAFHSDYARANRMLAGFVARHASRYWGLAMVHAARDQGRIARLVADAVRAGLVGIKVHRHDAAITREVCDAARRWQLPVLYDVGGETWVAELLAQEYPDVNFIVPHLGSFGDDWRAQQALLDPLARHANVYADTSGVRRFDLLQAALERAGPHKLLFGSDGPWLHPGLELHKLRLLGLRAADEALVLGGNWLRLMPRRQRAH